jgi:DNA-binding response OmpR family regulator
MTKVLYAEDELFLGKIVKESLESRGFNVVMEADGGKVFDAFKKETPDICILDVMMPNKDGFEVADEIRSVNEEVPIIFLTAKTQTEDVVKGFTLGGNDYIRKPFSMEELIARINNVLRNKPEQKPLSDMANIGKFFFHTNLITIFI